MSQTTGWTVARRLGTLLLLLISWALPVQAGVLPFPAGVRGGANIASLSFEDLSSAVTKEESRLGGFIAGYVEFPLLPLTSIEAGLSFGEQGGEIEGSGTFYNQPISGKATLKLVYMYVPVLAKVTFDAGAVKPYVKVGPQLGILLSSKAELERTDEPTVETDTKDDLETAEFSLQFGAGLQFPGNVSSFLEVGYSLGLTGVSKEPTVLFSQFKNRVLGVTAGFRF
jgi:hypothetical protein